MNNKVLMASYKVAYRIAHCKKRHTIAEEHILLAALDMVSTMPDETNTAKWKAVPLFNDIVSRRICDISNGLEEQHTAKLKDKRFALQVDRATDSNDDDLFIAYVRFVTSESLFEDWLFCKYIPSRATADELFRLLGSRYLTEHERENRVAVCTDGAPTMAGKRNGLQARIKRVSPNVQWMHCVIHRETSNSPELNKVLTNVVSVGNFINARPLKEPLFSALCEEIGAERGL